MTIGISMETVYSNPHSAFRIPHSQIFLVGFMACGKSTVGPLLAEKLHRPFIDLDREIEARTSCAIAELIMREGEEAFRQIESAMLREAGAYALAVIAPGGGAITRPENNELMLRLGISIWLDAPFELCWSRIKQDATVRPLAANEDAARSRYISRLPLYQSSTLRVPITVHQTPPEIVEYIQRMLAT